MRVTPAPFCAKPISNDPRYPPGDEESRERTSLSPKEANVRFKCAATCSTADYGEHEVPHVATLSNIKVGEELLVNYGRKYLSQQLSTTLPYKQNEVRK